MMSAMCITYSYRVEAELGVDIGKGGGLKINTTIRLNSLFIETLYKFPYNIYLLGCIQSVDWTTGLDYWTGLLDCGTCEIIEV